MTARRRWAAVAAVAAAIAVASLSRPPGGALAPSGPLGLVGRDKWLHALAFAALGAALSWALAARDRRAAAVAVAGAAGYGLAIELLQAAVPYRAFAVADLGANAVGTVVGVGAAWLLARRLSAGRNAIRRRR